VGMPIQGKILKGMVLLVNVFKTFSFINFKFILHLEHLDIQYEMKVYLEKLCLEDPTNASNNSVN